MMTDIIILFVDHQKHTRMIEIPAATVEHYLNTAPDELTSEMTELDLTILEMLEGDIHGKE